MKMAWQPRQEGLDQILQLLRESQSPDTGTQQAVQRVSKEEGLCVSASDVKDVSVCCAGHGGSVGHCWSRRPRRRPSLVAVCCLRRRVWIERFVPDL